MVPELELWAPEPPAALLNELPWLPWPEARLKPSLALWPKLLESPYEELWPYLLLSEPPTLYAKLP